MTSNKVQEVLDLYEASLYSICGESREISEKERLGIAAIFFHRHRIFGHAQHMIPKTREFILSGRIEKAMRWLGFLQGVLWVLGVYTLEELKDHNRPDTGDSTTFDPSA